MPMCNVQSINQPFICLNTDITEQEKLSYRKDDRVMRPMYENCRESLTTPTATFPEIFNGLLFRLSL